MGIWRVTGPSPYATYLYDTGVSKGTGVEIPVYQPEKNITRAEFFAMVARWMDLDLTQYANVELPFVDAASIPDWALNEVKAMYSLGILKGGANESGLTVNALATISRAEAMTILGRTQARGYAEPDAHLLRRGAGARLGGRLPQESGGPGCDHRQRQPHPPQRSAHPAARWQAALRHAVKDG